MTQIINGKKIADKIKDGIVKEIAKLTDRPNLAIILVGERIDSELYVNLKQKEAKKCGIDTHLYKFEENASEEELLQCINFINNDELIDGILLQLPLPQKFNTNKLVKAIKPEKDVDGFHPENLKNIRENKPHVMPPLAGVIMEICKDINCVLQNRRVAILANSDIFMQGVGNILQQQGAKILPCKYDKKNLPNRTKQADIVITAVGKKHYLNKDYIKQDAVIIDIGIIKDETGTYGDVDFDSVKNIASFITPVPGGVGPITIACAFRNVLQLYKAHKIKSL
ncbi:MAG: bifunctional 5,10-methylenetetrahydrofolate dehydrogenase/5,10-methenyltetrahydrofolate cyclohydrolase [Patescibacteria group bacterium]